MGPQLETRTFRVTGSWQSQRLRLGVLLFNQTKWAQGSTPAVLLLLNRGPGGTLILDYLLDAWSGVTGETGGRRSMRMDAYLPACVCMCVCACVCARARVCEQLCPTHCDPMDCSPPGSSVHAIFQARILEWVAISPYFTQNSFFVFLFGLCHSI